MTGLWNNFVPNDKCNKTFDLGQKMSLNMNQKDLAFLMTTCSVHKKHLQLREKWRADIQTDQQKCLPNSKHSSSWKIKNTTWYLHGKPANMPN